MLVDEAPLAVALPEVPLLAVLPGTGGLTRVTDKRKVRRDRADVFCSIEEGIKGKPPSSGGWSTKSCRIASWKPGRRARQRIAAASKRNGNGKGIALTPLARKIDGDRRSLFACRCRDRPRRAHGDHLDRGAGSAAARRIDGMSR